MKTNTFILISAKTLQELEYDTTKIRNRLRDSLAIHPKYISDFLFNQKDAFLSALATRTDHTIGQTGNNISSLAFAQGWPFNTPYLIKDEGFFLGFAGMSSSTSSSPVIMSLENKPLKNIIILGKSGVGKTLFAQTIMANLIANPRNRLFCFDPEAELSKMVANYNGINIDLSAKTPSTISLNVQDIFNEFKTTHKNGKKWDDVRLTKAYDCLASKESGFEFYNSNDYLTDDFNSKFTKKQPEQITLLHDQKDFSGMSNIVNDRVTKVAFGGINPEMLKTFIAKNQQKILRKTEITDAMDIYTLYKFIYDRCIINTSINPFRVVLSAEADTNVISPYNLFYNHKENVSKFFDYLFSSIKVVPWTWINTFITRVYENVIYQPDQYSKKVDCSIKTTKNDDGQWVINRSVKELINLPHFPTMQNFYDLLLEDFNNTKTSNVFSADIKEQLRQKDEVLSVLDNLVVNNRLKTPGRYAYLYEQDNKFSLHSNRFVVFNLQSLLLHITHQPQQYDGKIRFSSQNIFNAQYYLAQRIIWNFMVENRIRNEKLPTRLHTHGYVFIDEAHKSLRQPQFVDWSIDFVKRARKYQYGICFITQDFQDFDKHPDAADIFNNLAYKIYFQTEAKAFKSVKEKFALSDVPLTQAEEDWLNPKSSSNTPGQGLLTMEDSIRFMFNASTSFNAIYPILRKELNIPQFIQTLSNPQGLQERAKNDLIVQKAIQRWEKNNMLKYDPEKYYKLKKEREISLKKQKDALLAQQQREMLDSKQQFVSKNKKI